jgi:sulfur carrier protein
MLITVNNKAIDINYKSTLMELLSLLNYNKSVAVFVNARQLLQAEYEIYELKENDIVRIVKPLGGG